MDALSTPPQDPAPAAPAASVGATATPPESPLAMPTQRLGRFDASTRRKGRVPRLDPVSIMARFFVFGFGLALTVYGATEMYGVINVGAITPLKWALLVLFVINFSWIALAFTNAIVGFWWLLAAPRPKGAPPQGLREKT
ncbi:MAG TPA: glucan biosynthesis glucosyltransferase H, partial [Beijerinckiaceae bacterium]